MIADDVTWVIPGEWELAGSFDKQQMGERFRWTAPFDDFTVQIHSMIAEANQVATHTEVRGRSGDGRDYDLHLYWEFTLDETGKFTRVVEFPDSEYAARFWCRQD